MLTMAKGNHMSELVVKKGIQLKSAWEWIKLSFYTFRESPVHFILLSILSTFIGILPMLGSFMGPLFIARFADTARKVEGGEKLTLSTLLSGFFANTTLVRLGFLNFTLSTICLIGQYFIEMYVKSLGHTANAAQTMSVLVFVLPLLILQVAMWISPIICLNNPEIRPVTAMSMSIKVGLYNVATFILYSLLIVVFTILALLPVGLGLFIWIPVMNIASYYVYKTTIQI